MSPCCGPARSAAAPARGSAPRRARPGALGRVPGRLPGAHRRQPAAAAGVAELLTAEGVTGTDADVPWLRLTPGSVSRSVLLQLADACRRRDRGPRGRRARHQATVARVGWLAGLDEDAATEAIGALMADGLIEGERALRFVHPLVRSAVYQDMAPPLRQRSPAGPPGCSTPAARRRKR